MWEDVGAGDDIEEWTESERALEEARMRDRESWLLHRRSVAPEDVEVEGPRAVSFRAHPAELFLDPLQFMKQR